jgi:hypothetical protein
MVADPVVHGVKLDPQRLGRLGDRVPLADDQVDRPVAELLGVTVLLVAWGLATAAG